MRSVADLVMQAPGNLVEVDFLELSRCPCRGVGIFHAHQHRTGADDGEGNRPVADTGNVSLAPVVF